jgi:cation diffusion facilitator family transporter
MISQIKNTDSSSPEVLPMNMYYSGMRITYIGMAVNLVLVIIKFIAGILANSSAMIADSFHSLSDLANDFAVILGLSYQTKPADIEHTYGHGRIETVITMLMGIGIFAAGLILLINGGTKIFGFFNTGKAPVVPGLAAFATGIVSLVVKEILSKYTLRVGERIGSSSVIANARDQRSDALSSIGTVIGIGGAIILGNKWTILDPLAAIFVSVLIMNAGFKTGWRSVRELCDEAVSDEDRITVENAISEIPGVLGFHNLRTRSLGRYMTLDAHVLVDPGITVKEGHAIATKVEKAIKEAMPNAAFISIHIEPQEKDLHRK